MVHRWLKRTGMGYGPTANWSVMQAPHASSIRPPGGHIVMVNVDRRYARSGAERGDQVMAFRQTRNRVGRALKLCRTFARKRGTRAALTLRDVRCDPIANRALEALMQDYTVAEEESCLVLTKKTGDMKLFLNELDDLHQWEFVHNRAMAQEIDRLRLLLTTVNQHRESWKIPCLDGGGALAGSDCQNRWQCWPSERHRREVCFAQTLSGKAVPPRFRARRRPREDRSQRDVQGNLERDRAPRSRRLGEPLCDGAIISRSLTGAREQTEFAAGVPRQLVAAMLTSRASLTIAATWSR